MVKIYRPTILWRVRNASGPSSGDGLFAIPEQAVLSAPELWVDLHIDS